MTTLKNYNELYDLCKQNALNDINDFQSWFQFKQILESKLSGDYFNNHIQSVSKHPLNNNLPMESSIEKTRPFSF